MISYCLEIGELWKKLKIAWVTNGMKIQNVSDPFEWASASVYGPN